MARVMTVRANGASVATVSDAVRNNRPVSFDHSKTSRGWTKNMARRCRNAFLDMDVTTLKFPLAITLTLKSDHIHESAESFAKSMKAFMRKMRKAGMLHYAYVVEFTKSNTPHIHMLADFNEPMDKDAIKTMWLEVLNDGAEASMNRQYIKDIYNASGWLQYMSKQAGRSIDFYDKEQLPESWEKSPRLWSTTFPKVEAEKIELTDEEFFTVRNAMDMKALKETGKLPPKFNDARDAVVGRVAWDFTEEDITESTGETEDSVEGVEASVESDAESTDVDATTIVDTITEDTREEGTDFVMLDGIMIDPRTGEVITGQEVSSASSLWQHRAC